MTLFVLGTNQTCHKCHFSFKETSIQYSKRLRTKTQPLCKDCSRIANAEIAHKKREILKNETDEEKLIRKAKALKKKFGKVSARLLMYKLKISSYVASDLIDLIKN